MWRWGFRGRWRVGGEKELMVEGGEQEEEQAGGEKAS